MSSLLALDLRPGKTKGTWEGRLIDAAKPGAMHERLGSVPQSSTDVYSRLSASTGSTLAARRAGKKLAASVATVSTATTERSVA